MKKVSSEQKVLVGKVRREIVGEAFTHVYLWRACEELIKAGDEAFKNQEPRSLYFYMSGMLMAYFAYEAYLNYVGSLVAPEVWKNERDFFNAKPYRGIEGKLRLIEERCRIPEIDKGKRPHQTIRNLGKLRSRLAHGKPERYKLVVLQEKGKTADMFPIKVYKLVTPKLAQRAKQDVGEFAKYLHDWISKFVDDQPLVSLDGPLASASATEIQP